MSKFKIGDKVTLSECGVNYYSPGNYSGYPIVKEIVDNGGVVKSSDPPKVYVKSNAGRRDVVWFEEEEIELLGEIAPDSVKSPRHYAVFENVEAIEIIAKSLSLSEFKGYCLGNILKYRLRCGKKDNVEQELAKADFYKELYSKHKHLCVDYNANSSC